MFEINNKRINCYKKLALYTRVSKDDINRKIYSESIKNQKDILENFVKENNVTNYEFFIDDGYTGTDFARPEFERMKEQVKNKNIDLVIIKDLSRFGRNTEIIYYVLDYFPSYDAVVYSISENFESSTKDAYKILMFQLNSVFNAFQPLETSKKIKMVIREKQKSGMSFGNVPFGYKRDENNKFLVVPEEAEIIKYIFKLSSEGLNKNEIANRLNAEGVKTISETRNINIETKLYKKMWIRSTIKTILENEVYTGKIVQHKTETFKNKKSKIESKENWIILENMHQPIISKEIFKKVKYNLSIQKRIKKRKFNHLFKGLVFCKNCGRSIGLKAHTGYSENLYFQCYNKKSNETGCKLHLNYKKITNFILLQIKDFFEKINLEEIKVNFKTKRDYFKKEINELNKKINFSDKKISNLYNDKTIGIISERDFKKIYDDTILERKNIESKVKELEIVYNKLKNNYNIEEVENYKNMFIESEEYNKYLIGSIIKKIYISNNKEIEIFTTFDDIIKFDLNEIGFYDDKKVQATYTNQMTGIHNSVKCLTKKIEYFGAS